MSDPAVVDLRPVHVRDLLRHYRDRLAIRREEIDALNVFPVPDGDTGTNLLMTVRTALDELGRAEVDAESSLPALIARGTVMGARGNSGVIISQVFRGLAEVFDERGHVDAPGLADALERARTRAFDAVARPVEGTILTAIEVAAETAAGAADGADLLALVDAIADAVHDAVQRTTDQLEVLQRHGVVDAGALGFSLWCEALHAVVAGEQPQQRGQPTLPMPVIRRGADEPVQRETGSDEYRFEVQYLLEASEEVAPDLRRALERIGDSVVVAASGNLLNVHVHTNDIGAAIEEGSRLGRTSRIEITEFAEQIAAREDTAPAEDEVRDVGCVVVLPGAGLRELAEGMGARVIEGGAGSLPNVADLLNAVGDVRAGRVAILPGHPNVVPAAHQASAVSRQEGGRELLVVDTATSAPSALAALAVCDFGAGDGDVADAMREAAAACRAGEVVAAVRDADTPVGRVTAGQPLAVVAGDVTSAHDDPLEALRALAVGCGVEQGEVVTLIVGAGVDDAERDAAVALLEELAPGAELDVVIGDQKPARYLLGVE